MCAGEDLRGHGGNAIQGGTAKAGSRPAARLAQARVQDGKRTAPARRKMHTGSHDALQRAGLAAGAACHVPGWPVARIPARRLTQTQFSGFVGFHCRTGDSGLLGAHIARIYASFFAMLIQKLASAGRRECENRHQKDQGFRLLSTCKHAGEGVTTRRKNILNFAQFS